MLQSINPRTAWIKILTLALLLSCGAAKGAETGTWAAIIPEGFPGIVYSWQVRPGGVYAENGRDAATGRAVQPTYLGRWSKDGTHMVLRQNEFGYVFDGVVMGDSYAGTLYQDGAKVSRFCARKGYTPPANCGDLSA